MIFVINSIDKDFVFQIFQVITAIWAEAKRKAYNGYNSVLSTN